MNVVSLKPRRGVITLAHDEVVGGSEIVMLLGSPSARRASLVPLILRGTFMATNSVAHSITFAVRRTTTNMEYNRD